jgi:predicted CoA-substrate-specific enzyme activase
MYFVGIDIGSTASKTLVMKNDKIINHFVVPTGWSSTETAENIKNRLLEYKVDVQSQNTRTIATGYGRVAVPYADKILTEITCHGKGGAYLAEKNCTIIDIGGQDTKVITVENGRVTNFLMNDKCSAGTGKFIEIMANRLGVNISQLCILASKGTPLTISSMCTVFAESEVISHIGKGESREDIAAGIIDSVVMKVSSLCSRHGIGKECFLTGGLCDSEFIVEALSNKLECRVYSDSLGRYAGALGAALYARDLHK